MLLLRRCRPAAANQLEATLVPLTAAMAGSWPVHTRRCLRRLPERLRWATPLLDHDQLSALAHTDEQARELLLWLHQLPSCEHPIVGSNRRRPA